MPPCVSIILPVYNVGLYIEDTIASILGQTFMDFELLVVDDCSTDDTAAKVRAVRDERLRFIQNSHNLGRAGTDNAALSHVRGKFIAKMDGDDLCHSERLAMQVHYLENNPDINVVGSWMQNFGTSTYLNRYPTTPEATQVLTLFTPPAGNPSLLLRTSLFREGGMHYDEALRQTEDFDFFARYVRELRIANLSEALIRYRILARDSRSAILRERATVADEVRTRLLTSWGLDYTKREMQVHNAISALEQPLGDVRLEEVEMWLSKLIRYNDERPLFEPAALRRGLGERWFEVCYVHPQPRLRSIRQFSRSPLAVYFPITSVQRLKFWAKAIREF